MLIPPASGYIHDFIRSERNRTDFSAPWKTEGSAPPPSDEEMAARIAVPTRLCIDSDN